MFSGSSLQAIDMQSLGSQESEDNILQFLISYMPLQSNVHVPTCICFSQQMLTSATHISVGSVWILSHPLIPGLDFVVPMHLEYLLRPFNYAA